MLGRLSVNLGVLDGAAFAEISFPCKYKICLSPVRRQLLRTECKENRFGLGSFHGEEPQAGYSCSPLRGMKKILIRTVEADVLILAIAFSHKLEGDLHDSQLSYYTAM